MANEQQPEPGIANQRQRALELAVESVCAVMANPKVQPQGDVPIMILNVAAQYLKFLSGGKPNGE